MVIFEELSQAISATQVPQKQVALFWLGQASFIIKSASGFTIAIDPFLSDVVEHLVGWSRLWPPPLTADQLKVDVVVFSHDHVDHYDPETVPMIADASPHTIFLGPTSTMEHAQRQGISSGQLQMLNQGETISLTPGASVQAVYAEHLTVGDPAADAIGLLAEVDDIRIYHVGDTIYNEKLKATGQQLQAIDALLVPINGNYAVLNSLDAALYTKDVQPRFVIPMHYGMFANNTADPYLFVRDLKEQGSTACPRVMSIGSGILLKKT